MKKTVCFTMLIWAILFFYSLNVYVFPAIDRMDKASYRFNSVDLYGNNIHAIGYKEYPDKFTDSLTIAIFGAFAMGSPCLLAYFYIYLQERDKKI